METVAVTLTSHHLGRETRKDLLLPLDIPQYILIDSLIDKLMLEIDKSIQRGFLSIHRNNKETLLPVERTLRDVGVRFGDYLVLDFKKISTKASLVCVDGPEFGLNKDEMTIGCQSGADIDLRSLPKQEFVSTLHAKILCRDSSYYLVDIDSLNGTKINNSIIHSQEEVLLKENDAILLGKSEEEGIKMIFNIHE